MSTSAPGPAASVLTDVADGVATISLNRPARHNALDDETTAALHHAVERAVRAREVRVLVLRGEGPSFCSGRDTSELGHHGADGSFAHLRRSQELTLLLAGAPKPVLAALKGHVLGKGLEVALAADVRVAADGARLGLPEVHFGLGTDNGAATRLAVLAGPARAKLLLMTGDPVDAEQAMAWGLVDRLVAPADLDEAVADLARRLSARAPLAVAVAKEVVDQAHRGAVLNGTRLEGLAQLALFASEDRAEARAARAEERPPRFQGR